MNQTIENLGSFIMIIAVFAIIARMVKYTFDFILKRRLIKLGHINEESVKFLSNAQEHLQNIKWALLFFFGGLGLVVLEYIPTRGGESPLPYGIMAIFIAVGFFIYYIIARRSNQ